MASSKFVLSPVSLTAEGEWDEFMAGYRASRLKPLHAMPELMMAELGTGTPEEEKAFFEYKKRLLNEAKADPESTFWFKCTDIQANRIVGGGMYQICHPEPFKAGPPTPSAHWFPSGTEKRELAEELLREMWASRFRMRNKRYIYGKSIWVLPEYSSQGLASTFFGGWLKEIDKLQMEMYVEATEISVELYKRYGFMVISTLQFEPSARTDPSAEWKRLVEDLQSHPLRFMWRPVGWRHGGIFPWEKSRL